MKKIEINSVLVLNTSYNVLLNLYENDISLLVEDLYELMEEENVDELTNYIFFNIFGDLCRYYKDCWNLHIIPEIRDRLQNNKTVKPEIVISGLYNIPPKKLGEKIEDIIDYWLEKILDLNYENCPKELLNWMEEWNGLPSKWLEKKEYDHFKDELKEFTDPKSILEMLDEVDFDQQEIKIILIELAENSKANTNIEAFLEIIDSTKPGNNSFRPYHKEYITDIINSGEWDEDEWKIITEKFYNIDFDIPYGNIIKSSIQQEIQHIDKMNAINPNYRHD